jgi:hypothetical protein
MVKEVPYMCQFNKTIVANLVDIIYSIYCACGSDPIEEKLCYPYFHLPPVGSLMTVLPAIPFKSQYS